MPCYDYPQAVCAPAVQLSPEQRLALFRTMLRIRLVEDRIAQEYGKDEMRTPVHLCNGSEAADAAIGHALQKDDLLFGYYRGHGHYLAKGGDLNAMLAELHCKATGCAGGWGGSMHLVDLAAGLPGSSAIVGGGVPLATGAAFALQQRGLPHLAATCFGEAAMECGSTYESMNFAALKQLPLLYLCINNFYAVCSPLHHRTNSAYPPRAEAFGIRARCVDATDLAACWQAMVEAVSAIRAGNGPYFLEFQCYRYFAHGGNKEDYQQGYREEAEMLTWKSKDPVHCSQQKLLEDNILTPSTLQSMQQELHREIDLAFDFARQSPLPDSSNLMANVYAP